MTGAAALMHKAGLQPLQLEPTVYGHEPPISFDGSKWFLVMTNPQCEKRAQFELEALGYRTFMPKLRKWVSHARVKKAVERPILSRYLFVEVDYPRQSFGLVKLVNGVEALVSNNGIPVVVPSRFVEDMICRHMQGEWDYVTTETVRFVDGRGDIQVRNNGDLPLGARVKIVEGQFDNMLATIMHSKGNHVIAKLLDNASIIKIPKNHVRAA